MIGYYIHHVGRGHLHHALAVAARLDEPVTGLSSLPRPDEWQGDWIRLARDDAAPIVDPDAHGRLHWAPVGHSGLQDRMATIAQWLARARPRCLVVDLSVEVTALARLSGVRVVTFCLPGVRLDAAHELGWDLADAILAPWPASFPQLCVGLDRHLAKVCFTGSISRHDGRARYDAARGADHGIVLGGLGGSSELEVPPVPGLSWTRMNGREWCADPWPRLTSAGVVITHAGLAAIADVAAARAPAVVVAQERPFAEQSRTALALGESQIAVVGSPRNPDEWPGLVAAAVALGGDGWARWSDGRGAQRAADVIERVVAGRVMEAPCAS